jgi:hypothetical protein
MVEFRNYRLIKIYFKNLNDLKNIYIEEFKNRNKILDRNIRFIYIKGNKFKMELYGYDKNKKAQSSKKDFKYFLGIIDNMPMRKYDAKYKFYNLRNNLLNLCGLPAEYETSHCYNDGTHHTCCMLGKNTRHYSNISGNPIGKVSVEMFKKYYMLDDNEFDENTLTPWCTCIGSSVCSYYTNKFNDGTHIKFINNNKKNEIYYDFDNKCETHISSNIYNRHSTPGIIKKTYECFNDIKKIYKY